ncbi:MAG: DegT/DnrJ/EryC1/StrS family aminotransferase [Candidatus Woesearchaeota archaeon]
MIPRRDITPYKGILFYMMKYLMNLFYHKDYRSIFRRSLERFFGSGRIFLLSRGRFSLDLILDSVGYEKGDEIIVPDYYLKELIPNLEKKGLKVVLCDISRVDLSLSSDDLSSKMNRNTRFVILPHMFGICGEVDKLTALIRKKNKRTLIIEDCAHSFGAEYDGKKLGTFGDFSLHSFDYIKPLNTLGGGALLVNNMAHEEAIIHSYKKFSSPAKLSALKTLLYYSIQQIALKTPFFSVVKRLLRSKRIRPLLYRLHKSESHDPERLSGFQALIGHYQLKHFNIRQDILESRMRAYRKLLNADIVKQIPVGYNSKHSNYSLLILTGSDSSYAEEHLFRRGVDIGIKDEVMDLCERSSVFPDSVYVYDRMIQVPLHHKLSYRKMKKVAAALNSYYEYSLSS